MAARHQAPYNMEPVDKRRKAKIPVKNVPAPVAWMLQNATGTQLNFLNGLSKSSDFKEFVRLISNFKHYNVYEIYNKEVRTPEELLIFRASKVGELAGLDALIMASQLAHDEIERRKRMKA